MTDKQKIWVLLSLELNGSGRGSGNGAIIIDPISPGAFFSEEEAAYQVDKLKGMGCFAWYLPVQIGKFSGKLLKRGKR